MRNITDLAELTRDFGPRFYGAETPEYAAPQWVEALPGADLATFHEWLDQGFWAPEVAQELSAAEVFPWEAPSSTVYDLCNGDLNVVASLRTRRF